MCEASSSSSSSSWSSPSPSSSQKVEVCVRVRPSSGGPAVWSSDGAVIRGRKKEFRFEKVFDAASTNEEIYEAFARPLVVDAMRGYHGALLAYGQTGSGKTHTCQGTPSQPGLIPLAIEDIFSQIRADREYTFRVSYVEVYNETLRDLLLFGGGGEGPQAQLRLVEDPSSGGTRLDGVTEESVGSISDVYDAVVRGEARRHVGETDANARSSRSHAVLRFTIESKSVEGGELTSAATLSFCDLAGSERCPAAAAAAASSSAASSSKAASFGGGPSKSSSSSSSESSSKQQRQKEGAFINKSLHALAHVVAKLSSDDPKDQKHVPYRDSKLTRLLRPALGGNARVGIVCTCSPSDLEETANTLQFATRAKKVKVSAARNSVVDAESQLAAYKQQVQDLKRRLAELEQRPPLRDEERGALASALKHLERFILRKTEEKQLRQLRDDDQDLLEKKMKNNKMEQRPAVVVVAAKPAQLEPRFFEGRRTKLLRSTTLPPPPSRPVVVDDDKTLATMKLATTDLSALAEPPPPRVVVEEDGATTAGPGFSDSGSERHQDDDDDHPSYAAAAAATTPSSNDKDAVPTELTPQLLTIKAVIQRVLKNNDDDDDTLTSRRESHLEHLLKTSQDDTAFVLDQLDKAEAENKRLKEQIAHLTSVVRSREKEILQLKGITSRDDETF